jgi:putative sterol carrier protein
VRRLAASGGSFSAFFFSFFSFFSGPALVAKAKAVFEWKIGSEVWTLDLKNGNGSVTQGSSGKADCTLTMGEDVFQKLIAGSLNAQQAFMQGKLKIGGNMGQNFSSFFFFFFFSKNSSCSFQLMP